MKFNVDKCAVMHIGHNNINGIYTMTNQQLPVTEQQRDLGIIITKDLKRQQQTEKSCKTANRVLGFIARNFKYKNREMMLPLYKSLVRPHLQYAIEFWSPHLQRDIIKIEKIQLKLPRWFQKSGIIATANNSTTNNSSALSIEDYVDNSFKYSSTCKSSTMPQQEDFSTVALMTEQETMEKS